ncbi:MAG: PQQ-dependent sugar dehydrogenase [Pseudomonadales bacterium]|jgi:uncharacterized repeat protein (TIGR03806 family)|nr:PQQ-dependent sugar dehydrogenase [Pseudomonadales bacterium]
MGRPVRFAALAFLLGLVACGGGGGSGPADPPTSPPAPSPPPASEPFGLETREPLAPLRLPTGSGSPGGFDLEDAFPALPAFDVPLFVAAVPGEDRLVVVEQSGRLRAFAEDPGADASEVVLDLSGRVLFGGEQGLLGLAFDPEFERDRFLYVHYSASGPRRSVIARFFWDPTTDRVDPASERVILEVPQPYANHNGGMLAFGPDGHLYVALGDGGSAGDPDRNGQDPSTLLGSLLRLDVRPADPALPYAVPVDNPFVGRTGFAPELWAFGLRNPFRFSFDRQTGELWLGDVGQGAREEIDLIVRGGNYGWRRFEGTLLYDAGEALGGGVPHTPPLFEYGRDAGVSVIGGYVYRGTRHASLFGRYLYTDFGSGTVWALEREGDTVRSNEAIATASSPTSFGEDGAGELLVVSRSGRLLTLVAAASGDELPERLSETGLFTDLATLAPAAGLVEYTLNVPFWSDGTRKRRWFAVPDDRFVGFDATGSWDFPVGTVTVKHFELRLDENDASSDRRLETRLFVHTDGGWLGFTYRWNDAGTDAFLLAAGETDTFTVTEADGSTRTQRYDYPSRTDCLRCHTEVAGRTLGLETRQLNRDFDYALATDNQLRALNHAGWFDTDIGSADRYGAWPALDDPTVPVAERARAWLAANCASCHQPGGPTPTALDLRFDTALDATGMLAAPSSGSLGIADARIVDPGSPATSVLLERIRRLDDTRMPPLSSHVVDETGVTLVEAWIEGL